MAMPNRDDQLIRIHTLSARWFVRAWPLWVLSLALMMALLCAGGVIGQNWIVQTERYLPISFAHPLGTNDLGQDQFAYLSQALRSLLTHVAPGAGLSLLIGVGAGLLAGLRPGGYLDQLIRLLCDVFEGLPSYLLLVVLALFVGSSASGIAVLLAALFWPSAARAVRVAVAEIVLEPYTDAAKLSGASHWRIVRVHILSLLKPLLAALALMVLGNCLRAQILLGFVGLDQQAQPNLGSMLLSGTADALGFHFTSLLVALGACVLLLCALDALARRIQRVSY
jgi:peptide/nickel transport system permease protein